MKYEDYMRSARWLERRDAFFAKYRARCGCGSRFDLDLHHKTYERLGHEADEDLVPLCERCHKDVHRKADDLFSLAAREGKPITRAEAIAEASKYRSAELGPTILTERLCERCGQAPAPRGRPCRWCAQELRDRRAGIVRPPSVEPPMRVSSMPTDEESVDLSPLGILKRIA